MRLTRKKAIRTFCVQCMGNHPHHVRGCTVKDCPLYRYRMSIELSETVDSVD